MLPLNPQHCPAARSIQIVLPQHLVEFFGAYDGRLNGTAKHLVEAWGAGQRFPEAAADDSQAHAIVKASSRGLLCILLAAARQIADGRRRHCTFQAASHCTEMARYK